MEAAPAVQVVTVSDWPTIVAAVVGGLVGIAGIVAGYRQGKRTGEAAARDLRTQIEAENERALNAEKRRVYASYIAATYRLPLAALSLEGNANLRASNFDQALTAVYEIAAEVSLLSSQKEIRALANDIAYMTIRYSYDLHRDRETKPPDDLDAKRGCLLIAMRAELGESADAGS